MVSIYTEQHFGTKDQGADFILLDDLESFKISLVN